MKPSTTGAIAAVAAWSMPAVVTAAMVCPPILLVIPAGAAVAAGQRAGRRRRQVESARHLEEAWARWSQLDPYSQRGY